MTSACSSTGTTENGLYGFEGGGRAARDSGCAGPPPMLDRREEGDLLGRLVEEVVGRVRHKRKITDVCYRATARRRWEPSSGVQPLDEGGLEQRVATGRSLLDSSLIEQDPGNRRQVDGDCSLLAVWVSCVHLGPDAARVPVLPRGANHAIGHHLWISVRLKRVGGEVVGDDLPAVLAGQGGRRRRRGREGRNSGDSRQHHACYGQTSDRSEQL